MALSKLKELRMKKGWTQWELAKEVGISETLLSRIENQRVPSPLRVTLRLAEILKVPPEQLEESSA